jgi:hypothetical protein
MDAEFLGGPVDGMCMAIPDNAKIWIFEQAPMTAAEFIAQSEMPLMKFAELKPREHAYALTTQVSARGAHVFTYVGERVKK